MPFCKNCGSNIPEGAGFCSSCGTPVQDNAVPEPQQYEAVQQTVNSDTDAQNNKAMGILSYFGILCLIPLFAAKDSKFAQYHARQGFTLFIFEIAYSIVTWIIETILSHILPWTMWGLYSAVSGIFSFCYLFFLVAAIIGIVYAAKGETKELPLIGKIDIIGIFMKN